MLVAKVYGIVGEPGHEVLLLGICLDMVAVVSADDLNLVHAQGALGPGEAVAGVIGIRLYDGPVACEDDNEQRACASDSRRICTRRVGTWDSFWPTGSQSAWSVCLLGELGGAAETFSYHGFWSRRPRLMRRDQRRT
ncbi:hypothetical protein IF1G_08958 [Cordyceps javanica]|uniref:Uncharacterized protein n=1 Tax=Cordyceps javanica TaxID=43265 RepID=A0A545USL5_9HYPO|nr:hypothetical protein IF1G_08958 [Cordyceps javanica]